MSLPPVKSCTHSALGHVLHPLCPNFSTTGRVTYLGIAILGLGSVAAYIVWNWPASKPVTVVKGFDASRYRLVLAGKFESFPEGREAVQHAEDLLASGIRQKVILPKTLTNSEGQNIQPIDLNIAYFAAMLDYQKLQINAVNSEFWKDKKVVEEGYKAMEVAFVLASLAVEELSSFAVQDSSKKTTEAHEYCMNVILDCLSLYHVIRTGGSLIVKADGSTTYKCPTTIDKAHANAFYNAAITPQFRTKAFYNSLFEQVMMVFRGGTMPDNWPKFCIDMPKINYICPLSDLISDEVRPVLDDLFGGPGSTDALPLYTGKDPISAANMTAPIMKGIAQSKPFIAIRMNQTGKEPQLVLLEPNRDMTMWYQVKFKGDYPCFFQDRTAINPSFIAFFTDFEGKLDKSQKANFNLLKSVIRVRGGKDSNGKEWIIQ